MPNKNEELSQTERKVLSLCGRYRILFAEALAELVDCKNAGIAAETLKKLARKKYLEAHTKNKGLAPNCPYYTLTPLATSLLGLSRERAMGSGVSALSTHVSILWFCAFGGEEANRMRVDNGVVNHCFATSIHHNNHHIAVNDKGRIIILRTYNPNTALRSIATWCSNTLRKLPPPLKQAVSQGDYGLAILSEAESSVEKIRQYLGKPYKRNTRLMQKVRILVELAPSTATYPTEYVRKFCD